jgi:hypothetical protein
MQVERLLSTTCKGNKSRRTYITAKYTRHQVHFKLYTGKKCRLNCHVCPSVCVCPVSKFEKPEAKAREKTFFVAAVPHVVDTARGCVQLHGESPWRASCAAADGNDGHASPSKNDDGEFGSDDAGSDVYRVAFGSANVLRHAHIYEPPAHDYTSGSPATSARGSAIHCGFSCVERHHPAASSHQHASGQEGQSTAWIHFRTAVRRRPQFIRTRGQDAVCLPPSPGARPSAWRASHVRTRLLSAAGRRDARRRSHSVSGE